MLFFLLAQSNSETSRHLFNLPIELNFLVKINVIYKLIFQKLYVMR